MAEPNVEAVQTRKQAPPAAPTEHTDSEHHHSEHEYPFVAHHFDSPQQQFDAGKLGIWLFLVTEVLFFAGLFCAYTIYRAQHPEIFSYAHYYLDTFWGAVNTVVLIFSSLTAAWAVRNAQLGQKKLLIANILITIGCAFAFMCVKYVEYSHKFHDGLLPGKHFEPAQEIWELEVFKKKHPEAAAAVERIQHQLEAKRAEVKAAKQAQAGNPTSGAQARAEAAGTEGAEPKAAAMKEPSTTVTGTTETAEAATASATGDATAANADDTEPAKADATAANAVDTEPTKADAAEVDATTKSADATSATAENAKATGGEAAPAPAEPEFDEQVYLASLIRNLTPVEAKPLVDAGIVRNPADGNLELSRPAKVGTFFGIYFFMTGLHGFHVFAGIVVWVWLLFRAIKGQFGPLFFGPIDFAALYWHLVDLIWIYLFPLLYLIH